LTVSPRRRAAANRAASAATALDDRIVRRLVSKRQTAAADGAPITLQGRSLRGPSAVEKKVGVRRFGVSIRSGRSAV
jgi:hypothetical protein